MARVAVALEQRKLRISKNMHGRELLVEELTGLKKYAGENGYVKVRAAGSGHDDTAMALGLVVREWKRGG